MKTYKSLIGEANALYKSATEILSNPDATAEQKSHVQAMLEDADKKRADAAQLHEIEAKARELAGIANAANEPGPQSGKFADWGEFLQKTWEATRPGSRTPRDERLRWFKDESNGGHEQKTMTENVGASGGFLVPPDFMNDLYGAMGENSIVRSRATIIRMNRRQVSIPVVDQTGTTAGTPHWFGGMSFYWGEEGAEKTATDAQFRQVTLTANKLYGYTRASDELVDDSAISLADFLSGPMGFAGGLAWMEDYAFLNGTGVGQPLGIINAGATITVNRTATSPAVSYTDVINMRSKFWSNNGGVWIANISLMDELMGMNGPSGNPSYIWQMNAVDGIPGQLLGYPIIFTEKTPVAGSAGDLILADFSKYLLGDRQATTIESTQFDYWRYDQTSWRAVHRVDGQPWMSAPFTLQDGTSQISPFVILGAKST